MAVEEEIQNEVIPSSENENGQPIQYRDYHETPPTQTGDQINAELWKKYSTKVKFSRAFIFNYAILASGMIVFILYNMCLGISQIIVSSKYVGGTIIYFIGAFIGFITFFVAIAGILPPLQFHRIFKRVRRFLLSIMCLLFLGNVLSIFIYDITVRFTFTLISFIFIFCLVCFISSIFVDFSSMIREKHFLDIDGPPIDQQPEHPPPIPIDYHSNTNVDMKALPANWEERFDDYHQKFYYVNHNLKTTQWEDPRIIGINIPPVQMNVHSNPSNENVTMYHHDRVDQPNIAPLAPPPLQEQQLPIVVENFDEPVGDYEPTYSLPYHTPQHIEPTNNANMSILPEPPIFDPRLSSNPNLPPPAYLSDN
mmetsp:Transcript_7840/g.11636  ORF Transcript_7840/g.11636 Transcript_7840/m.11636 type:complete len:366 (+) Transcript_7840:40-1137(+)